MGILQLVFLCIILIAWVICMFRDLIFENNVTPSYKILPGVNRRNVELTKMDGAKINIPTKDIYFERNPDGCCVIVIKISGEKILVQERYNDIFDNFKAEELDAMYLDCFV